ncbi:MAG: hypothetical protein K0R03_2275 [Moraxellaceae bacterium]|nr:hypothetical protein [Moraxellaceae bacterium]
MAARREHEVYLRRQALEQQPQHLLDEGMRGVLEVVEQQPERTGHGGEGLLQGFRHYRRRHFDFRAERVVGKRVEARHEIAQGFAEAAEEAHRVGVAGIEAEQGGFQVGTVLSPLREQRGLAEARGREQDGEGEFGTAVEQAEQFVAAQAGRRRFHRQGLSCHDTIPGSCCFLQTGVRPGRVRSGRTLSPRMPSAPS